MSRTFNETIQYVKSVKIQGAEAVAKEGTKSLLQITKNYRNNKDLYEKLQKAKKKLFNARPTEPALRNSINYALAGTEIYKDEEILADYVEKRIRQSLKHFETSREKIIKYGEQKIKNHMTIYTHCHSSTVTSILKAARRKGKHFFIKNTETRPLYQGRKTAKELAKAGIPVEHYVDSAMLNAIEESDIILLGADAITEKGKVINKIGSGLIARTAKSMKKPVYICTDSWKYDPETKDKAEQIEERDPKEIWERAPKGVRIHNYAFEVIPPETITGIISEYGIHKPKKFVSIMKEQLINQA